MRRQAEEERGRRGRRRGEGEKRRRGDTGKASFSPLLPLSSSPISADLE
jgi:hypothetical protein